MANTKISALTNGTTADATDKIPVERSGANRYITPGYIKTYLGIAGTLSVASGKTFTASNTLTLTGTDGSTLNVGTGGTLGALATTTPGTGVATAAAAAVNGTGGFITYSTYAPASGKTLTVSNTLTFTGTDSSSVAFGTGGTVLYSGGALGTPASGTLTNCTGLPVGGISATGTPGATTYLRGDGSWQTVSATPGGSDTQIQFNDGGSALGGDAGLTYNKTTNALTITGGYAVIGDGTNPAVPTLSVAGGTNITGTALSGVAITGTAGEFSCSAATLEVGQTVTISGTAGGTGSITGYSNATTYRISVTNGSTTFTLVNASTGAAIVTTAGTPTGLTYTVTSAAIRLTQTWNNSNVQFTGIRLNVTNTASATASRLIDLQIGGSTAFTVRRDGAITSSNVFHAVTTTGTDIGGSQPAFRLSASSDGYVVTRGDVRSTALDIRAERHVASSTGSFAWNSSTDHYSGSADTFIYRDAANVVAQRNSTTAQTFRVYSTYTDGSNYQRLTLAWNTTTALVHNQGAGTGADGSVAFNDAALATDATKGFVMIPSCAGAPTGVPADIPTGQIPLVFDSTNNKLYVYDGGWLSTAALT